MLDSSPSKRPEAVVRFASLYINICRIMPSQHGLRLGGPSASNKYSYSMLCWQISARSIWHVSHKNAKLSRSVLYSEEKKKQVAEKQQYVAPADFTFVDVSTKGSGCYLFACFYFCVWHALDRVVHAFISHLPPLLPALDLSVCGGGENSQPVELSIRFL